MPSLRPVCIAIAIWIPYLGTAIAKGAGRVEAIIDELKKLSKSTKSRDEIAQVGTEAGAIAGTIVFGVDIADAEGAVTEQQALVRQLFTDALAEARANLDAQTQIVNLLRQSLDSVTTQIAELVAAIRIDLYDAFASLLSGLPNGLSQLGGLTSSTQPTNTNIVINGSIIYFSECGVRYVMSLVETLLRSRAASIEVRRDVHDTFNAAVDAENAAMAWGWSPVSSWYKNEFGRVSQNWPFTLLEYWQRTLAADPAEYVFG